MFDLIRLAWIPTLLVLVGILVVFRALVVAHRRKVSAEETALRLLRLAETGRADEARIEARNSGRVMAPVLRALGGGLSLPTHRPLLRDLTEIGALVLPIVALVGYGLVSGAAADPDERVAVAIVLFLGLGLLLPLVLGTATGVVMLSRSAGRFVRGVCIRLVARRVEAKAKGAVFLSSDSLATGPEGRPTA